MDRAGCLTAAGKPEVGLVANGELEVIETGNEHVLGFVRTYGQQQAIILANFSESEQILSENLSLMLKDKSK